MAFNREDLITWSELAPSLQKVFKSLQEEVSTVNTKIAKIAAEVKAADVTADSVNQQIATYIEENVLPKIPAVQEYVDYGNDISQIRLEAATHKADKNAHPNIGAHFLLHKTSHKYKEGEIVHVEEFPTNMVLQCETEGISSNIRPDFNQIAIDMEL